MFVLFQGHGVKYVKCWTDVEKGLKMPPEKQSPLLTTSGITVSPFFFFFGIELYIYICSLIEWFYWFWAVFDWVIQLNLDLQHIIFFLYVWTLTYVWYVVRISPRLSDAAMAKIAQGTKVFTEGGYEKVFQQEFHKLAGEKLLKAYACYISTSNGPVIGTLYISTQRMAFCSDYPLSHYSSSGQQEWVYFKVSPDYNYWIWISNCVRSCQLYMHAGGGGSWSAENGKSFCK